MSLYIVEANTFDPFFNKRYNLCYGYFLKQMQQRQVITHDTRTKSREAPQHHQEGELPKPRGGALENADQR
ncbi:MAG: hypothetical protein ACKPKO_33640, partial [Candidatus Fonsibacter sp.]